MSAEEVTYLTDPTIAERLWPNEREVLALTQHGWPLGRYENESSASARHATWAVHRLIDAHMSPLLHAPDETEEAYRQRLDETTADVHRQLDQAEEAFMSRAGESSELAERQEASIRFGGQAAMRVREIAVRDARRFLIMEGYLEHDPRVDPPADEPFAIMVDPSVALAVFRREQARQLSLTLSLAERTRILDKRTLRLAQRLGWS